MSKKLSFYAVIFFMALCSTANATVVSYEFTADIYNVFNYNANVGSIAMVNSSSVNGSSVAVGDTVTGKFTYDTQSTATGSMQFVIDQDKLSYDSLSSQLLVINNTGSAPDIFYLATVNAGDPTVLQNASLALCDLSGTAFPNSGIPTALDFDDFAFKNLSAGWVFEKTGNQVDFNASITSLTQSGTVPEPASSALFLFGFILLYFTNFFKGNRRESFATSVCGKS